MINELIELQKAERHLLNITQRMIVENVDMSFIDSVTEKINDGMTKVEAFEATLEEFGYHLKSDVK